MPARELPNLGLKAGFEPGENGWADEMDLNLLRLSVLTQGTVLDKVPSLPGSPAVGDRYILDETHATHANEVAIWDGPTGEEAWVYVEPIEGWLIYNQAEGFYEKFSGTAWAELETGGGGGGGLADAPSDNKLYGRKNAAWTEIVSSGGGEGGASYTKVAPRAADFITSWSNNGMTGSILETPAGVVHYFVIPGTGRYSRFIGKPITVDAPFAVIAHGKFHRTADSFLHGGLAVVDSANNDRYFMTGMFDNNNVGGLSSSEARTSITSNTATALTGAYAGQLYFDLDWRKITYDGTTLKSYGSTDGVDWIPMGEIAKATLFPAQSVNAVGFTMFATSVAANTVGVYCDHFEVGGINLKSPAEIVATGGGGSGGRYNYGSFVTTSIAADEVLMDHIVAENHTLAANLQGCYVNVGTNPAASFVLDVQKNGVSIGTITISTAGLVTKVTTGGLDVPVVAGDLISVIAQPTPDAGITRLRFTLSGAK